MKIILALSLALGVAQAACPNACSGHGTCGTHDECVCYKNYGLGDCSARICPYYTSWVTTPQGDRNGDGDIFDGTVTSSTNAASNHPTYFSDITQGISIFEAWPVTKKAGSQGEDKDEGHYFMECANQGLCDRKTGQCECFTGYEGVACRRSSCPNQCSGNGVCRTVSQIGAELSSHLDVTYAADGTTIDSRATASGSLTYDFWDKDMSQACVCDAGFTGPDCAQRQCPLGDDPLTTGQHNEIQWVDVYASVQFTGTIVFEYTDLFGDTWSTVAVTTSHFEGAAGTLASDAEAALRALPDQMTSGVSVTASYCEIPYTGVHAGDFETTAGDVAIGAATDDSGTTGVGQGIYSVTSGSAPGTPTAGYARFAGLNAVFDVAATGIFYGYDVPAADVDDTLLYKVAHPFCVRYEIEFDGRSGDIPDIHVDTSGIVVPSGVDECDNSAATTADGHIAQDGTTNVVTVTVGALSDGSVFSTGDYVHIDCAGASYGIVTLTDATSTAVTYDAAASSVTACGDSAGTMQTIKIQRVVTHTSLSSLNGVGTSTASNPLFAATTFGLTQLAGDIHTCTDNGAIATSAGVTTFTCTGGTTYNSKVHYNERVAVKCGTINYGTYTVASSTGSTIVFQENVADCAGSSTVKITMVDRIVKTDIDVVAMSSDHDIVGKALKVDSGEICNIIELIPDSAGAATGTRFKCSVDKTWTSKTLTTSSDRFEGDGSTEYEPCSTRGVCDTSVGLCECFKGYSGDDCSSQNALSA